jgi:tRNA-specific 2-thiouridylase
MSSRPGLTVVAMSGGVDSAVAAALLARSGREVVGVSLRLHDAAQEGGAGRCCSPEDFRDARLVAGVLGIPYYVLDAERSFSESVLDRFREEYRSGRTPSPCVSCNTDVKFGTLLEHAASLGAQTVATGHYTRLRENPDGTRSLLRAADGSKDQSYFLFELDQRQLARAEFPVGELKKEEVRAIARELGLAIAEKPESQDICFVPGGDYRTVLAADGGGLGMAGEIVTRGGAVLGRHAGIGAFTIGQRKGLGVASADPLYVLQIEPEQGRVVVGSEDDLQASELRAAGWKWVLGRPPESPARGSLRIRYRHPGSPASIEDEGPAADGRVRARFDSPQRAVTPGQAAVLYDGEEVLGGGWIEEAVSSTIGIASESSAERV